jgi:hypothetical protein
MKRSIYLAAFLVFVNLTAGISAVNAAIKTQRDIVGFTSVSFGISGNLEVKIGPEFSVVLEGDQDDIDEIITKLTGEKLVIRNDNLRFLSNNKVNVYITVPELKGLDVSGSGKAEILDVVKTEDLKLFVSGSGKLITSELIVENLECKISGSGNVTLGGGKAANAVVLISGSGNMAGEATNVDSMDVSVSGSGNCSCYVTGSLDVKISGSGNVIYRGNPGVDAKVSGSGHVKAKN